MRLRMVLGHETVDEGRLSKGPRPGVRGSDPSHEREVVCRGAQKRAVIALASLMAAGMALAQSGAEMFQRGVTQERAGKLDQAIKIYEQVARDFASDRALAAKALLEAAACYEKLGQDKAGKVYEEIASKYGDQREAVTARAKIAALRQPAAPTLTYRRIEFASGIQNVVATDGQNALLWDAAKTTLYYSDIGGKNRRVAYQVKSGPAPYVFPSRDLSVAVLFRPGSGADAGGWAVTKTDGTGYLDLHALRLGAYAVIYTEPSWSWDNRYFLIFGITGLLKISAADGGVQELTTGGIAAFRSRVSPDGHMIAFDDSHEGIGGKNGNVYVMSALGGQPQLIAKNSHLVDWNRDGSYLMVGESQSQDVGLRAVPFRNGRAGEPVAVPSTLVAGDLSTAPGGGLVVRVENRPVANIYHATLDSNGHLGSWQTLDLADNLNARYPRFSPDGRQIVYATGSPASIVNSVRMYTFATREDREMFRYPGNLLMCLFASAKRTIWCNALRSDGTDLIAIGADSGQGEKVRSFPAGRIPSYVSFDDRFLNLDGIEPGIGPVHYRWEIGSDSETRLPGFATADGRWVLRFAQSPDKPREIQIRPTEGEPDAWRTAATLYTAAPLGVGPTPTRFTQDGKWLVYCNADPQGRLGLYRVATSGGEPERLGDYPTTENRSYIAISGDDRQFIVQPPVNFTTPPEFWILENFLPKSAGAH